MAKVTDPALLAQLNGEEAPATSTKVTDSALLAQLNGEAPPEPKAPEISKAESFGRGAAQGITLGFGDELAGVVKSGARGTAAPPALGNATPKQLAKMYPGVPYEEAAMRFMHEQADKGYQQAEDQRQQRGADYEVARDETRQANADARKANPKMSTLGNVAGGAALAPIAPSFKALQGAGWMGRALAALGTGAAYGGVGGTGGSDAKTIPGVLKDAGAGTAIGGVTAGLATPLLEGGAGLVQAGAEKASGALKDIANSSAAKALKGTASDYASLGKEGIQRLGRWLLDTGAVKFGRTSGGVAETIPGLGVKAKGNLADVVSALDSTGASGLDKKELASELLTAAVGASKKGPAAKDVVNQFMKAAQEAEEFPGARKLSFSEGENWKQGYQEQAYPKGKVPREPTPTQATDAEIARITKQHIEDEAEKAAQGTDLFDRFMQAKRDSGSSMDAARIAAGAEGRAAARNTAGPSDTAMALAEFIAHGNPVTAVGMGAANHMIRGRAASSIAAGADTMGSGSKAFADWLAERLAQDPPAVGAKTASVSPLAQELKGRFGFGLQAAAADTDSRKRKPAGK